MTHKIGDVIIGLIFLSFIIGGISGFIINADETTGLDSGIVSESLGELNSELGDVKDFETELTTKTDETGVFNIDQESQQIENRGSDSSGVLNLLSKNILVKFFAKLSEKIPGLSYVLGFFLSLFVVGVSILFLRFFWGDNKI